MLGGGQREAENEAMYRVLSSKKSYNTEFGLPLTILELESEFSSVVGWGRNVCVAIWRSGLDALSMFSCA